LRQTEPSPLQFHLKSQAFEAIVNNFDSNPLQTLSLDPVAVSSNNMADSLELPADHALEAGDSSAATEVFNSVKVSLADLCAKGTAAYAHKNYDEASDVFARASELQAELNGEMSPENAEILFLYGRSIFKVGQSKSDVLGGKAGGEKKKPNGAGKPKKAEPKSEKSELDRVAEEGVAIIAEQNGAKVEEDAGAKKPLFQFTGDENFEDSDSDAEVGSAHASRPGYSDMEIGRGT
jgi:HAT1-interacting factor 1